MSDRIKAAAIIGASIIVGAALWGGRYTTSSIQQGGVYLVDRFTGDVLFCVPKECRPIHWNPTSEAVDEALSKAYDEILKGKKSN
jgi:hypothetical protein